MESLTPCLAACLPVIWLGVTNVAPGQTARLASQSEPGAIKLVTHPGVALIPSSLPQQKAMAGVPVVGATR